MKRIIGSKVLLRYILSYLLLIGVLLLAVAFSIGVLQGSTRAITEEGNRLAVERYKAVMDAQFAAMIKISDAFILDETVQNFLRKDGMENADRYDALHIRDEIKAALQRYGDALVREVFIYFPGMGKVITSGASVSDQLFFQEVYRLGGAVGENYADLFLRREGQSFGALRDISCTEAATGAQMLMIYRTIARSQEEITGVIGFLVDRQVLESFSRKDDGTEAWEVFICAQDGSSLFSSADDEKLRKASMTISSDTFGVQYRLVSDYAGLAAIMRSTEKTFFVVIGVSIAASLILAGVLAFVNYRPIRRLWVRAAAKQENERAFHNEIEDIDSHISAIVRANTLQRDKLDLMRPVYSSKLLSDFVNGKTCEPHIAFRKLEDSGILLDKPRFLVMLLKIDVTAGEEAEDAELWEDAAGYDVSRSAVEAFSGMGTCCCVRQEEKGIQLLLNFDEACTEEEIRAAAMELQRRLIEQRGISVSFALGGVVSQPESIWESAMQAQRTMDAMYIGQMTRVASYQDLDGISQAGVDFFQDYETRLRNYIQAGHLESVRSLLDEVFGAQAQGASYLQTELLMVHVLEICLRTAQQLGVSFEKVYAYDETVLAHIQRFRHVSQFKGFILEMAGKIAKENADRQKQDESFKSSVIDFIQEHYADINLNVSMIADHFGVSQSYLSTHFKRQTGINASDYIHIVRINRAKEMMQNRALSLTQIAKKLGYVSDATFIRSFKKYEGITPGTYRKNFVHDK